jgi:hypothetical protein
MVERHEDPEEFEEVPEEGSEEGAESAPAKPKFTSLAAARRRVFLSFFYMMQMARVGLGNALGGLKRSYAQYSDAELESDQEKFLGPAKTHEALFEKILKGLIEDVPAAKWLVHNVRGVAWSLAGQLVAIIGEIGLFDRVSNLWSYAGLKPQDRRQKGVRANWNPELKRCLYNFATCAVKAGGFYAEGYVHFKAREERRAEDLIRQLKNVLIRQGDSEIVQRIEAEEAKRRQIQEDNAAAKQKAEDEGKKAPKPKVFSWEKYLAAIVEGAVEIGFDEHGKIKEKAPSEWAYQNEAFKWLAEHFGHVGVPAVSPAHRHMRALRKIEKLLLQHLWLKWRELEDLPVSKPWVFDLGGHDELHLIAPPDGKQAKFPSIAA